ncbi:MAG TPA: hypothetical protein VF701_05055 [Thermoanaerobaculia bacterium]
MADDSARVAHLEAGITLLRQLLFAETDRRRQEIAERDHIIVTRQTELMAAIEVRDTLIRDLQSELFEKVGARDRLIIGLQAGQPGANQSAESLPPSPDGYVSHLRAENARLRGELDRIHRLRAWKILSRYWAIRERIRGRKSSSN